MKLNKFPQILGGPFGREILDKYNARVKEDFSDNKYLKVFSYDKEDFSDNKYLKVFSYDKEENVVKGSNTPGNILLNQIIFENDPNLYIATQSDLEVILRANLFNLRGTYEDTGLVLRSESNLNEYFAKDLSKQLRDRNKLQYPVLIHLKDLTLRKDSDSPLGVSFDIKENAGLIHDKILNHDSGYFSSEDINPKTGLPTKLESGNRYFHTINSGLSRLFLDYELDSYVNIDYLTNSYGDGRVIVVSFEGANFCENKLK